MAANSLPLDVKYSCDLIMNRVRDSSLNFSMQETPFSLYLTIRKTFVKSSPTSLYQNSSTAAQVNTTEIKDLKSKLRAAEESNSTLKSLYEEAVEDNEHTHIKVKELEKLLDDIECKVNQNEFETVDEIKREMQNKDSLITN
jgi:hypothetical protein